MPAAARKRSHAGRLVQPQRFELGARGRELLLAEAAADLSHVDETLGLLHGDVDGAEARPRSLRAREPHHREISHAVDADLLPVAESAAPVGGMHPLRHDSFETELAHARIESAALTLDVIDGANGTRGRDELQQQLLPLDQRQRPQIEVLERQKVEEEQRRGQLRCRALHVARRGEQRALLQPLEDGSAGIVEHRDLSVRNEPLGGERQQRAREIRKDRRGVRSAAIEDARTRAVAGDDGTESVVLQLEEPVAVVERVAARLGQHRLHVLPNHRAPRGLQRLAVRAHPRRPLAALAQVLDRETGKDGRVFVGLGDAAAHVPVAGLLDQQPLLSRLALDPNQRPHPLQLEALQLEEQLAGPDSLARVSDRTPQPAVPDDHGTSAVFPVRNDPLEVGVLDRVILGLHRQPLLGRIGMRTARHRPGLEHAVPLESQVVMHARSAVFLHDKNAGPRCSRTHRLRGAIGRPLAPVFIQQFGHLRGEVIIHAP